MEPDTTCERSTHETVKTQGFQFWKNTLREPVNVVAPMVDQSELPWRMLSRKHRADLCYTPMLHAQIFCRDPTYRSETLRTCPEDRPLIVQFCANDPDILLKAAKIAEEHCDAIDINLGCPQAIARRGHYGAYLQDEWELITELISRCHAELKVPITAKCRVFESIEKTVEYARMLEKAGAQLLTVHGRTREQKGPNTGLASWAHIKAVREAVKIPMFANGNIQFLEDVGRCIAETGVQGVMIAEGNLHNPALFDGVNPPVWEMIEEYLEFVEKYPCNLTYVRGHIFKMCIHAFDVYNESRMRLGECKSLSSIRTVVKELTEKLKSDQAEYECDKSRFDFKNLKFPYWICQPYVRPKLQENDNSTERKNKNPCNILASGRDVPEHLKSLSKKKLKKALKNPNRSLEEIVNPGRPKFEFCENCKTNARGTRCDHHRCKTCCKAYCRSKGMCCPGHHFNRPLQQTEAKKPKLDNSPDRVGESALLAVKNCGAGTEVSLVDCDTVGD